MEYSQFIDNFLSKIRSIKEVNSLSKSIERDKDLETQDILHRLELGNDSYHDTAKLSQKLKKIRQERRDAKDKVVITEPILLWIDNNKQTIKSLEKLLGEVRKLEKSTEDRYYIDKTEVIKELFLEN